MAFLNGTLQLLEPAAPRGHRLPIDFLFRSLAADLHERAIGIVLSGTGSDGTLIPQLFEDKPAGAPMRVWSTGCSTGEEAYSIAIDRRAITVARTGVYPASITDNISPERLVRYFTTEPDGSAYRIHKSIRDRLVFSEQDVIKDPPFSKLDLISCRNLLIYLNPELQKQLISLFHYALQPGGLLFLGSSETAGKFGDLFAVLDRKSKLYQRKKDFQGPQRAALDRFLPALLEKDLSEPPLTDKTAQPSKLSLRASPFAPFPLAGFQFKNHQDTGGIKNQSLSTLIQSC